MAAEAKIVRIVSSLAACLSLSTAGAKAITCWSDALGNLRSFKEDVTADVAYSQLSTYIKLAGLSRDGMLEQV